MSMLTMYIHTAVKIRTEALGRLTEIADHGCEAASARAFEEGRLAALDELGLGQPRSAAAMIQEDDDVVRQRRLELDEALRERGTSRPDRDPLNSEPIVRPVAFDPVIDHDGGPQRLINHRPDCSLRTMTPERHGTASMTCTCDYWQRARQEQPPPIVYRNSVG